MRTHRIYYHSLAAQKLVVLLLSGRRMNTGRAHDHTEPILLSYPLGCSDWARDWHVTQAQPIRDLSHHYSTELGGKNLGDGFRKMRHGAADDHVSYLW